MTDYRWRSWPLTILVYAALGTHGLATEELLVIEPSKGQPRNSEGDLIELTDGRLCLIYTRFTGGASDHDSADLAMRTSTDGGKTWSSDRIVVPHKGGRNVMSVSLLRLQNGDIGLFYLQKMSLTDCRPIMRLSADEAATWSEPVECITDEVGYYVLNNDRAVQLANGRLVLPVAQHASRSAPKWDGAGQVMCYLSDDLGETWRRSRDVRRGKAPDGRRVTVQEPGVVELSEGRLMMFCRTDAGSQFISHSTDGGDTWSELTPSKLASPLSPASIERIPNSGKLLCVWNDHSGAHAYPAGKRTPLCLAVSHDEGVNWSRSRLLEADPDGWYCYTAMGFSQGRLLLAYCAGDSQIGRLNRLKITAISEQELEKVGNEQSTSDHSGRQADDFLLDSPLDYGRSYILTKAPWNSPRFWIESRCRISDPATGKTVEYYQCGSCKSEHTFANENLFMDDNYDFLPIFSAEETLIFRRHSRLTERYREVRATDQSWDGAVPKLRQPPGRILQNSAQIHKALTEGDPIIGQTEIRDAATGRVAVLEYPIKTLNYRVEDDAWQVDTGPVLLPDLSLPPAQWTETLQLAFVAYNGGNWADFVVERPTTVPPRSEGEPDPNSAAAIQVMHYSGLVHKSARNVLIAQ